MFVILRFQLYNVEVKFEKGVTSLKMATVQARVLAGSRTQTTVPVTGDGSLVQSSVTLSCICQGVCLNPTPSFPPALQEVSIRFVC